MSEQPLSLSLHRVLNSSPGWYQGDFHCHTHHSDGELSPQQLLDVARAEGMDFFAITDHNTLDAYPGFGEPQDVCVIPGLEITFDQGHYNVFGITQRPSWMEPVTHGPTALNLRKSGLAINSLLEAGAAGGLLNSINHPLLAPWAWLDRGTALANVHCLEIWNDPSWGDNRTANPQAIDLWMRLLNAGYRMTAIGGSDYHRPTNKPGVVKPPDRLGLPRTFVYAESLSGAAILDGVRRGRAFVSMGPSVRFAARRNGESFAIGDQLGSAAGEVEFTGEVDPGTTPGVARIVQDGAVVHEVRLREQGTPIAARVALTGDRPTWCVLDVRDDDGLLLAITNPIFAGPLPVEPALRTYGDFVPSDG
jgi:hypothetical protein